MKGKHSKLLIWGGVAVGVVILVLLARRSSDATTTTLGGDATGSGSGGPGSDALIQAKSQAFQTLTQMLGQRSADELQAATAIALGKLQVGIEQDRNATTLGLASIQADSEGRAADAAARAVINQQQGQVTAAVMQGKVQDHSQTLNFLGGVVNTVGQVIEAIVNRPKKTNTGGYFPPPAAGFTTGNNQGGGFWNPFSGTVIRPGDPVVLNTRG